MTSLANRLLVGGCNPRNNIPTNQLAVFESGEWTHPYPPMNIARSAVSFNNHIIVAGGWEDEGRTLAFLCGGVGRGIKKMVHCSVTT